MASIRQSVSPVPHLAADPDEGIRFGIGRRVESAHHGRTNDLAVGQGLAQTGVFLLARRARRHPPAPGRLLLGGGAGGGICAAWSRRLICVVANQSHRLLTLVNLDLGQFRLLEQFDQFLDFSKVHYEFLSRSFDFIDDSLQRQKVGIGAESRNHARGQVAEVGVVPKRLAAMRVAQMNLDERQGHRRQRVADGNRSMRKGSWIDENPVRAVIGRRLNALDQLVLGVGLEGLQIDAVTSRQARQTSIDRRQGIVPVDLAGSRCPSRFRLGP